jgi:molecular chaperone GrpE
MSKHKAHGKKTADPPAPAAPSADTVPSTPDEHLVQPETAAPSPAPAGALLEPDAQALQRLSGELEQVKDRHLRLAAEFDNFKKRKERERVETWSRAQAELVAGILDALDDLGRVAHLDPQATAAKDVVAGVELVERKLARALSAAGLERLGAEGEPFDPNVHEAVTSMPASSAKQDHQVASVMQPGYRFGGALLRPARVAVYLWQEPEPAADRAAPDVPDSGA